jgi:hypothetical protein
MVVADQASTLVDADGVVVCAKPLARSIAVAEQARLQQAVWCEGCPGDTRRRRVGLRDRSYSLIQDFDYTNAGSLM